MKVWVLFDEAGEYSSYGLAIDGVFTDPEKAKAYLDAEERYTRERYKGAQTLRRTAFDDRTPWQQDDAGDWHSEVLRKWGPPRSWTIQSFEIDELFQPPREL